MNLNILGRSTIGIEGPGPHATIDLDVVTSFKQSYAATVTKFPIEKAPGEEPNISDYVVPGEMSLTIEAIVSSTLFSLSDPAGFSISSRQKMAYLTKWMRQGSVLTIHGYGTQGGLIPGTKELAAAFATGSLDPLYQGEIDDPFVFGLDSDTIQNVLLTKVEPSRELTNGTGLALSLTFTRVRKVTPGATVVKGIPKKSATNPPAPTKSPPNAKKQSFCTGR